MTVDIPENIETMIKQYKRSDPRRSRDLHFYIACLTNDKHRSLIDMLGNQCRLEAMYFRLGFDKDLIEDISSKDLWYLKTLIRAASIDLNEKIGDRKIYNYSFNNVYSRKGIGMLP